MPMTALEIFIGGRRESEHRPKYPTMTIKITPIQSTQRDRRPVTSLSRLLIGQDVDLMQGWKKPG